MRIAFFLLALTGAFLMNGCCKEVQFTPERPSSVRGWQGYESQGTHVIGEFVLKKGESVENNKFGVQLIKTITPIKCNDLFEPKTIASRAVVRIYDASTKETLATVEVTGGTSERIVNTNPDFPAMKYGINSIFPMEINTKDEWIWIELLK